MGFYRGPNIVTDGLVLALDPGSARSYDGTTAWNDLSSAKSVYTLNNGVTYQSINGGVFDFDGVDDYASTSSAPLSAGATAYSIEAVFKADSTGTQVIWEQGSTAQIAGKRVCMILLSTGTGGFNGQNADFQTSVNYSINTWYNWLITVDTSLSSNKIKIYVNGVLSAQGNPAATLNAGADGARVGNKLSNSTEDFDGNIALVRAYNRVLTAAEALQNFNAQKSRFGL
tara:strand:+ start:231 stop:914 length:684 start_codon:yes stop_codon:yes gene_type:complete